MNRSILADFRDAIRAAEARGESRRQICARAGIDPATASRLMSPKPGSRGHIPGLITAIKLAVATGHRLALIPLETTRPHPQGDTVDAGAPEARESSDVHGCSTPPNGAIGGE